MSSHPKPHAWQCHMQRHNRDARILRLATKRLAVMPGLSRIAVNSLRHGREHDMIRGEFMVIPPGLTCAGGAGRNDRFVPPTVGALGAIDVRAWKNCR